jgi:hypothetical protein
MFDLMPASMRAGLEAAALSSGHGWQMPPIPLERLGPLGAVGAGVDLSRVRELLAGIPIHVLPTGHFPMMTMPVELADLLESLLPV